MSSEGYDETTGVIPRHLWKCLIILEAFDFVLALSYDSCLVSFNGSICIVFGLKYRLTTNRFSSSR